MYELTCPYCGYAGLYWEVEGHFNQYVSYLCGESEEGVGCGKKFHVLHRSWFDPTYDNHDVEVRTDEWIQEQVAAGALKRASA